ncbi:MAG: hypothetical protein IPM12_12965 [Flavobacteriales bacterium]|nr:hypothetical protein [Flavobacteriales bacterium]
MKHQHSNSLSHPNTWLGAALILVHTTALAQTPEAFRYQAVARDGGGQLVVNTAVGVQFQLHQGSAGGTVVYAETHSPTTNAQGLFSVAVGEGTPTTGTFSTIPWSVGSYWVEVGLDPAGGTAYSTIGVQQLLSVPYALQAKGASHAATATHADTATHATSAAMADSSGIAAMAMVADSTNTAAHASTADTASYALQAGPPGSAAGEIRYWNGAAWVSLAPGNVGDALVYCGGVLRWGTCSVQERLDAGQTPCEIVNSGVPLDSLYGRVYQGGMIGYLNTTTCQGLVAAMSNLPTFGSGLPWRHFSCQQGTFYGTSTGMFTGAANTALILAGPCAAGSAAQAATSPGPGWYLPSRDELWALRNNLYLNGHMPPADYWSSSELAIFEPYWINFFEGIISGGADTWNLKVRPVKQF